MELNLKNDIIFKIFFAKKGNEEFLIDFLEALLKVKIKTIKIGQEVDLGSGMTEEGTDYGNIKKVILINILDYEFLPFEEYVSNTVMVLDKHREYEMTDKIKFY